MLHYDDSASDKGAVDWLMHDPRCHVSYNMLVLDDGEWVEIAPSTARAWHAGVCRPSVPQFTYKDANSAFYGIAAATNAKQPVAKAQFDAIVGLCRGLFTRHGWDRKETWRITGHDREAWPRWRKIDPTGPNGDRQILSVDAVRAAVSA